MTKVFGATRAVDGVDLAVRAGCVYAFLGPNGAGKTTTIRILTTLLRPDAGTARVLGHDVVKEPGAVRRSVSLTCQFASVDEDLTGFENLVLLARLLGYSWRRGWAVSLPRRWGRWRAGGARPGYPSGSTVPPVEGPAGGQVVNRRLAVVIGLAG